MKALALVAFLISAVCRLDGADVYFPAGTLTKSEQEQFEKVLSSMKEPGLSSAGRGKDYLALRILYLPGWGERFVAVRYEGNGDQFLRRSVMRTGEAGPDMFTKNEKEIPEQAVKKIFSSLEDTGIWNLVAKNDAAGFDGSSLLIETIKDGEHRVFTRWAPESNSDKRGLAHIVAFYRRQFQEVGFWPVATRVEAKKAEMATPRKASD